MWELHVYYFEAGEKSYKNKVFEFTTLQALEKKKEKIEQQGFVKKDRHGEIVHYTPSSILKFRWNVNPR